MTEPQPKPRYSVETMGHRWKVVYECQGSRFWSSAHDTKREAMARADLMNARQEASYD